MLASPANGEGQQRAHIVEFVMDIKLNNVFKTEFNTNEIFGRASSVAIGIISGLVLMYKIGRLGTQWTLLKEVMYIFLSKEKCSLNMSWEWLYEHCYFYRQFPK